MIKNHKQKILTFLKIIGACFLIFSYLFMIFGISCYEDDITSFQAATNFCEKSLKAFEEKYNVNIDDP